MSDQPAPPLPDSKTQQRQIRVFISSTFRDMHEERNYLVTHIFPQLRKLCDQRGVVWGEVDLRWGINDEQKAEGKVLPICLEEIKRCRPYFIGLLGERYGWVPDAIPQELVDRESWLKEHLGKAGKSVTELEILHGVLNDPEMTEHAFFYFRDPAYIESIPPEKQKDFTAEDAEGAEKLRRLKERIRKGKFPPQENYPNPKALGELILKDLTAVIERLYPKGSEPSPLDRDAMEHEAFAQSRAKVYIGRKEYFDRLDEHVHGDGPPLVILGESGSGKSALLANWALQYRQKHSMAFQRQKTTPLSPPSQGGDEGEVKDFPKKDELLIMHFIGSTPYSADWMAMLRRIMGEFKRRFDIQGEIPDKPDALRQAFANWLYMAAAKGKVVLILDALNQLEDRDGAPDLVWLPPVMPPKIRLILSTLPAEKRKDFTTENAEGAEKLKELTEQIRGRPLEELKRRDWPTLTVEPLNQSERKKFIKDYLKQYVKELDSIQTERIAAAQQTANPLYLRALLEELRLFGEYEELDKKITYYLEAQNPYELYTKVIIRWEEDYEEDNDLVGESMSLIWAARRGLSEGELLDVLGRDGEPLPQAIWSPLFLAAEESLVNRSGLLNFFHDYLRDAVRDTYIPTEDLQKETHMRLAGYFEKQFTNVRKIKELPWQLKESCAWKNLYNLLADLTFFEVLWNTNEYDALVYWSSMENHSEYHMMDAYRPALDSPSQYINFLGIIKSLFAMMGYDNEVIKLTEYIVEGYRTSRDIDKCKVLQDQAFLHVLRGEHEDALRLNKEMGHIFLERGDKHSFLESLDNQGIILVSQGNYEGAIKIQKEVERVCREQGYKDILLGNLNNQSLAYNSMGDFEGAIKKLKEAEQLCKEKGDIYELQACFNNQALILGDSGDLENAMQLYKKAERICYEAGFKKDYLACLNQQVHILVNIGDLKRAMQLSKEMERVSKDIGDTKYLLKSLNNQGRIFLDRGDLDEAKRLLKEMVRNADNKAVEKGYGKPQYTPEGDIICPQCKLVCRKGSTFCIWCKAPFKFD